MARNDDPDQTTDATVVPMRVGGPAHGLYEPFKSGNLAAVKSGAYSPRIVEPLADAVYTDLVEQHPRLRDPLYAVMVRDFARTLVRVERMEERLTDGDLDADGQPVPGSVSLLRYRKHLMNLADRLGLTPLANARLGKDTAAAQFDVAKLMAEIAKQENSRDDSA
ncbi:MAG: hypothetical protein CME34_08385 [Gordonia sp.]|uniref:hypothetical protein n=1 Tax=Gordonia sp. (in: high G+C Gram-positive bacteria) TaxID=84139 RepID=UPI000C411FA0|nr:hypothetical protein [Gordonia sp. (in: high G+C Gram-positive bacteria)]MAU81874.1 hypothetical protein [Gordonia sp. (in: high G+C Gram-positive bacteria)]